MKRKKIVTVILLVTILLMNTAALSANNNSNVASSTSNAIKNHLKPTEISVNDSSVMMLEDDSDTHTVNLVFNGKKPNAYVSINVLRNGSYYDYYSLDTTFEGNSKSFMFNGFTKRDHLNNLYTYSMNVNDHRMFRTDTAVYSGETYDINIETVGDVTTIIFNHIQGYVAPRLEIEWIGGPSMKPTVDFKLYKDGSSGIDSVTLNSGDLDYTWENQFATDIEGSIHEYTIDDVITPLGYTKMIDTRPCLVYFSRPAENTRLAPPLLPEDADCITKIQYTYVGIDNPDNEKTSVNVDKIWEGGLQEHPSIELQLYQNEKALGNPVTLENGNTHYSWEGLNRFDENEEAYEYTVREINVPDGYKDSYSIQDSEEGRTITITNKYVSEKTKVTVVKNWVGGPEVKPIVEIQLYQNGIEYGDSIQLDDTTTYTWDTLDATDKNGELYIYTVDELNVPQGYTKTIDGFEITNTYHENSEISITGRKVWIQPTEEVPTIQIQLFQNNIPYGDPIELTNGNTVIKWERLPLMDVNGDVYEYTIDEIEVPEGYEKSVVGFTIFNVKKQVSKPTVNKPNTPDKLPSTGVKNSISLIGYGLIVAGIGLVYLKYIKKEQ